MEVLAQNLAGFKEVHYPQVKLIENCICEVLTRKQQKYCDVAPSNFSGAVWEFALRLQLPASNKMRSGMAAVGFEPTPPKRLVPKTSALDHSAMLPGITACYPDYCSHQWSHVVLVVVVVSVNAALGMQCHFLHGGHKGSVAEWSKALV